MFARKPKRPTWREYLCEVAAMALASPVGVAAGMTLECIGLDFWAAWLSAIFAGFVAYLFWIAYLGWFSGARRD